MQFFLATEGEVMQFFLATEGEVMQFFLATEGEVPFKRFPLNSKKVRDIVGNFIAT